MNLDWMLNQRKTTTCKRHCEIIKSIHTGLCSQLLAQSSSGPWNLLSDKSTRSTSCSNEATPNASWKGLVTTKAKPWLEPWNFQPLFSFSREDKGAGNGVNNWSRPREDVPSNPNCTGFGEHPVGWTHPHTPGGWGTPTPWDGSAYAPGAPRPRPVYLFIWLFIYILFHIL